MPSSTSLSLPPFTTEDFSPSPYPLKDQLKLQQTKGREQPCTPSQVQAGGQGAAWAPRPCSRWQPAAFLKGIREQKGSGLLQSFQKRQCKPSSCPPPLVLMRICAHKAV